MLLEISGPLYEQKLLVDDRIFMSRIADLGGQKTDMAEFILEMIKAKKEHTIRKSLKEDPYPADFTNAERKVITCAFKNGISSKRTAIRIADSILENPKYARWRTALNDYKTKYQNEIFDHCKRYLDTIKDYCIER